MAYIGLRKPYIGKFNPDDGSYSIPTLSERAIAFSVTPNFAEGSLAADDDPNSEYDKEFVDADVTLGTDTITNRWREDMFGNEVSQDGEVASGLDDEANYVGCGVVVPEKIRGTKKWVGLFLPLVKFAEPADELETKGSSITYKTPSIAGKAKADADRKWRYRKVCATEAEADAYVLGKFGAAATGGSTGGSTGH